jgi:small GTP-binding protein
MNNIMNSSKQLVFKIVIAGDGGTGKSTLIATKNKGTFQYTSKITIGVDFDILQIPYNQKFYTFQVWDLGGQDRFQFIHDSYIKGAKGAILLYDLTRQQTFDHLQHWLDLLYTENSKMPIILAGTKKDMVSPHEMTSMQIQLLSLYSTPLCKYNIKKSLCISSKTMDGIDAVFDALLQAVLELNCENLTIENIISAEQHI